LAIKEFKDSDEVLQLWIVMTEHFSKDEGLLDSLFKLALPVKSNATEKIQIMHLDHVFNTKGIFQIFEMIRFDKRAHAKLYCLARAQNNKFCLDCVILRLRAR